MGRRHIRGTRRKMKRGGRVGKSSCASQITFAPIVLQLLCLLPPQRLHLALKGASGVAIGSLGRRRRCRASKVPCEGGLRHGRPRLGPGGGGADAGDALAAPGRGAPVEVGDGNVALEALHHGLNLERRGERDVGGGGARCGGRRSSRAAEQPGGGGHLVLGDAVAVASRALLDVVAPRGVRLHQLDAVVALAPLVGGAAAGEREVRWRETPYWWAGRVSLCTDLFDVGQHLPCLQVGVVDDNERLAPLHGVFRLSVGGLGRGGGKGGEVRERERWVHVHGAGQRLLSFWVGYGGVCAWGGSGGGGGGEEEGKESVCFCAQREMGRERELWQEKLVLKGLATESSSSGEAEERQNRGRTGEHHE